MAGYDHWLWRLFYWLMGYRWYWLTHPDQPITAEAVGRLVRHQETVWRLVELSNHRFPHAYVVLPQFARDDSWLAHDPAKRYDCPARELVLVSHVLMSKRLHDFVCCEGWAADREACYTITVAAVPTPSVTDRVAGAWEALRLGTQLVIASCAGIALGYVLVFAFILVLKVL